MNDDKIVTLGEPLLRITPADNGRFAGGGQVHMFYGGAEANVAAALACFGIKSSFVGKVPENEIGENFVRELERYGVDTGSVVRGEGRMGLYYLEQGFGVRPSRVIYDRADSAMTKAVPEEFDWENMWKNARIFHISGITPAISEKAAALSRYAVSDAKKRGVIISLDMNYRQKLWTDGIAQKQEAMRQLAKEADFLFGNVLDAHRTMGYAPEDIDFQSADFSTYIQENAIRQMAEYYQLRGVFFTVRESLSASHNRLSARAYLDGTFYTTGVYDLEIMDRVGSGDAFAAGILYGISRQMPPQEMLNFALTAGAAAHTIKGDFMPLSAQEIIDIAKNFGQGQVER